MAAARRRPPDPGRLLGRGDDDLPGPREPADHGSGRRPGGGDPLCLQPPLHEPPAGAARRPPGRARPADGAGQAHLRWVGGQRGGAAARAQLPHRTRRRRPLAGDLAGSGLPRGDHGGPGAERPAHPAAPARRLPGAPPAPAAEQLALRPDRPGRSRRSRRGPRRGGSGDRRRGLLRARRRRRVARPCRAGSVLGRLGGTSRPVRIPRLLRRGRQRGRPGRQLVRRRATPDRARHRHDRQEPRRGPRSGRGDAVQRPGLRGDRGREPRVRPRSHLGRRAPAVRRRSRGGRRDRRDEA